MAKSDSTLSRRVSEVVGVATVLVVAFLGLTLVIVVTAFALISFMFLLMVRVTDPLVPRAVFGILNTLLFVLIGLEVIRVHFSGGILVAAALTILITLMARGLSVAMLMTLLLLLALVPLVPGLLQLGSGVAPSASSPSTRFRGTTTAKTDFFSRTRCSSQRLSTSAAPPRISTQAFSARSTSCSALACSTTCARRFKCSTTFVR